MIIESWSYTANRNQRTEARSQRDGEKYEVKIMKDERIRKGGRRGWRGQSSEVRSQRAEENNLISALVSNVFIQLPITGLHAKFTLCQRCVNSSE